MCWLAGISPAFLCCRMSSQFQVWEPAQRAASPKSVAPQFNRKKRTTFLSLTSILLYVKSVSSLTEQTNKQTNKHIFNLKSCSLCQTYLILTLPTGSRIGELSVLTSRHLPSVSMLPYVKSVSSLTELWEPAQRAASPKSVAPQFNRKKRTTFFFSHLYSTLQSSENYIFQQLLMM